MAGTAAVQRGVGIPATAVAHIRRADATVRPWPVLAHTPAALVRSQLTQRLGRAGSSTHLLLLERVHVRFKRRVRRKSVDELALVLVRRTAVVVVNLELPRRAVFQPRRTAKPSFGDVTILFLHNSAKGTTSIGEGFAHCVIVMSSLHRPARWFGPSLCERAAAVAAAWLSRWWRCSRAPASPSPSLLVFLAPAPCALPAPAIPALPPTMTAVQ